MIYRAMAEYVIVMEKKRVCISYFKFVRYRLKFYYILSPCQSVWYQSVVHWNQSSDQVCLHRCFISCTMYSSTSIKKPKDQKISLHYRIKWNIQKINGIVEKIHTDVWLFWEFKESDVSTISSQSNLIKIRSYIRSRTIATLRRS